MSRCKLVYRFFLKQKQCTTERKESVLIYNLVLRFVSWFFVKQKHCIQKICTYCQVPNRGEWKCPFRIPRNKETLTLVFTLLGKKADSCCIWDLFTSKYMLKKRALLIFGTLLYANWFLILFLNFCKNRNTCIQ